MGDKKIPNQFEYMQKVHNMVMATLTNKPTEEKKPPMICMECGKEALDEKLFTEHGMCGRCFIEAMGFDPIIYDIQQALKELDRAFMLMKDATTSLSATLDAMLATANKLIDISKERRNKHE